MSTHANGADQYGTFNEGFVTEALPQGDISRNQANPNAEMVRGRQPISDPEKSFAPLVPGSKFSGSGLNSYEGSDQNMDNGAYKVPNGFDGKNQKINMLAEKYGGFKEREGEPLPKVSCFRYPLSVYFMLGNEFCERFSYYGMRAVLTLYFVMDHGYSENTAKMLFHSFVMTCYATPILGSILADGFIGRFKVIFIGSIVYVVGHVFLSVGAVPALGGTGKVLDFIGLFVIALSTGGIKPCVAAFAADQFGRNQKRLQAQFFAFFYFSINLGALLSKIVTPLFRSQPCLGHETCFPLAFGVPSILMFLALLIFIAGKPFYMNCGKTEGFVLGTVGKIIGHGLKSCGSGKGKNAHWLDGAKEKFDPILVENVKGFLRILILFMPLCLFWALFDQQGSTWVLMARRMNGKIGNLTILPDQMSVTNPVLIIFMVPIFQTIIYPMLNKCKLLTTPLQRMTAGGFLAMMSFVVAGLIQMFMIESSMVQLPPSGFSRTFIVNHLNCSVQLPGLEQSAIASGGQIELNLNQTAGSALQIKTGPGCTKQYSFNSSEFSEQFEADRKTAYLIAIFEPENSLSDSVQISFRRFENEKAGNGKTELLIMSRRLDPDLHGNVSFIAEGKGSVKQEGAPYSTSGSTLSIQNSGFGSNIYSLIVENKMGRTVIDPQFASQMGEIVGIVFDPESEQSLVSYQSVELVPPNTVSILWQIPQYILISSGEILLSITGLEFSYSQAAPSMKSVLQATWLLTTFVGNLIDLIISGAHIVDNAGHEFFIYAGLMGAVMAVFMVLAHFYEYIQPDDPRLARADDVDSLKESPTKEEIDLKESVTSFEDASDEEFQGSRD